MTHMFDTTSIQPGGIANVSRRFVMKGIVGSGALVLGAEHSAAPRHVGMGHRRRQDARWHRQ